MNAINKTKNIKNMYEGIMALYEYYKSAFFNEKVHTELENKEMVRYASVANSMLNLIFCKEKIVENKGELNYQSKIFEEFLEQNILSISKKVPSGYKINDYIAPTPATLIAVIRNSLAHGEFEIIGNNVILDIHTNKITINIDKLALLTYKLTANIEFNELDSIYNKRMTIAGFPFNINDFISGVSNYEFIDLQFIKENGQAVSIEQKKLIDDIMLNYTDCIKSYDDIKNYLEVIKLLLKDDGFTIKKLTTKLGEEELEIAKTKAKHMLKNGETSDNFLHYLNDLKHRDYYENKAIIQGCNYNYFVLKQIKKMNYHNCDIVNVIRSLYRSKIIDDSITRFFSSLDVLIVSTMLSTIVVLYGYPLDDLYNTPNILDGLDFSKLDLSKFAPTINKYNTGELEQRKIEYISIQKNIKSVADKIEKYEEQYKSVGDIEKLEIIRKNLIELKLKYEAMVIEGFKRQNIYLDIKDDYDTRKDYYIKRNIIEGIRHSIAHGNVSINKFLDIRDLDDLEIRFVNNYKDTIWFDATVRLGDLETLISAENIDYIFNFCEKKKTR